MVCWAAIVRINLGRGRKFKYGTECDFLSFQSTAANRDTDFSQFEMETRLPGLVGRFRRTVLLMLLGCYWGRWGIGGAGTRSSSEGVLLD